MEGMLSQDSAGRWWFIPANWWDHASFELKPGDPVDVKIYGRWVAARIEERKPVPTTNTFEPSKLEDGMTCRILTPLASEVDK